MLRGTVDRVRFRGAALVGNALGDPAERELIVYLPPGYAEGSRRYPCVMVLPGFAANNASLLNFKPWEPNLFQRYERLLAQGCGEAILVLPDCFTRLGGSQFIDSPAQGDYQRYLCDDVLPLVDARYRTLARRSARAIVGKSSGGYGALRMGFDRPESFAVIGSHAGDCAFELSIRPRFHEVAAVYERHGGAERFLEYVTERGGPRGQGEFHALEILALAHAYAPVGRGFELPFDPYTAELDPQRWERWLACDPVVLAERSCDRARSPREGLENGGKAAKSLRDARLVFLDAGTSDEYGLQFGARMLAGRLRASGVTVEHEEFDGGHMGTAYRYDVSLPKLIAALDPPRAADTAPSALADEAGAAHTSSHAPSRASSPSDPRSTREQP